jgi:predicted dehydrogenase
MTKDHSVSRRKFLKRTAQAGAAAVAFPYIVPASALGADGHVAPSNRIVMASIGVGGQGTYDLNALLNQSDVQMVAVCDVDKSHRDAAKATTEKFYADRHAANYKACDAYGDFREVLARDDIDAVLVATPDHWHAPVTVAAARAGKDIYCEKPLAYSIPSGRAVVEAVNRYGRVLQTGSHERSRDNARYACELVRNGRIGKLQTIRVNMPVDHGTCGNVPEMPIPEGFDYDFWLGPAPIEPYTKMRCHFNFRYIFDYAGGEVTDRGAHIIDLGQLGNGTDDTGPTEVSGTGEFPTDGLFNTARKFRFEFGYANGVRMICESIEPRGIRFEGTDGWIFIYIHGGELAAEPASLLREVIEPGEIHLGRSLSHYHDFVQAVKTRGTPKAPAETGHRTASMCHLGNIAMRTGRKLQWDPALERFVNDDEANRMLHPTVRGAWHV